MLGSHRIKKSAALYFTMVYLYSDLQCLHRTCQIQTLNTTFLSQPIKVAKTPSFIKITKDFYLRQVTGCVNCKPKQTHLPNFGQHLRHHQTTVINRALNRRGEIFTVLSNNMWESIFLTLAAAAGNNIGKVLQKKGTVILPPLSLKLKVIRAYAVNKAWVMGFLMDICGAMLMLRALSQAPVSVVQPVSGCGLAILSVFSHFYLKEVMNVIDWIGITLAGIGTIGVGAGGEEQEASSISVFQLPWLAFIVAIFFVGLNGWLRVCKRERRGHEMMEYEVVEEIIYGLESGILFGMASVISKMAFVFLEQGFSRMMVPICLSISICCSASGFYYQTCGLKHGRAIVVSTCAAVASIVTGVLAGMLALGERLPSAPAARLSLLLGWLLIIVGVILLVSSTRLLRRFPRPFRRWMRSKADRNFNISRSGSVRVKDMNPSAVIQTATLHQLISTPAKEKA